MTNWIRNIFGRKAPMVTDEREILSRQITTETREELHKTVQRVLNDMLLFLTDSKIHFGVNHFTCFYNEKRDPYNISEQK